jgi:hypothetical protein
MGEVRDEIVGKVMGKLCVGGIESSQSETWNVGDM